MANLVRFDWAIKKLLRNKANYDVLEGFLSVLLGRQMKIHRFLESEGNQETESEFLSKALFRPPALPLRRFLVCSKKLIIK